MAAMLLRVNGVVREFPDGLTAAALVTLLGVKEGRVAVTVNAALLPREERAARRLEKGDQVEIVPLLGGA